jgi:threonine dehydratase
MSTPMSTPMGTPATQARPIDADAVDRAAERLRDVVVRTPLQVNERLSAAVGAQVWIKREDLQPVRSYKLRGAYHLISQLTQAQRSAGVVCASAGNHAQGVALSCARLGIDGTVFLPRTTPRQKRDRIATLGGDRVRLVAVGHTYDDASAAAQEFAEHTGATPVPAFDDPRTAAGQGTVAREIVEQLGRAPDLLVVPVGGGGLLAGVSAWLGERHPATRVVGVEPAGAASMAAALQAGHPVRLAQIDGFVDGAAVRQVGAVTFPVVRDRGAHLVTVDEGRICTEMLALYQADGIIAEPAGAMATAVLPALLDVSGGVSGYVSGGGELLVVCVLSGGNNDVSRYAEILERSLVHEGLKHYFLVDFPQEPGALRRFLDEALGPDDDITLFEYVKRSNRETGPALVGIELARRDDLDPLLERLGRLPAHVERVTPDQTLFRFLI